MVTMIERIRFEKRSSPEIKYEFFTIFFNLVYLYLTLLTVN